MVDNFLLILWLIISLPMILIFLNIFQLEEYSLKKFLVWCLRNLNLIFKFYMCMLCFKAILITAFYIDLEIIKISLYFIYFLLTYLYLIVICFKKFLLSKTPLKITKRIVRFLIFFYLLVVLIIGVFFNKLIFFFNLLFLVCFAFLFFLTIPISYLIESFVFIYYKNKALKKLKKMNNLIVIGITGSYGKTSVKNILASILSEEFCVCSTPKSYNTPNGIIKSINENLASDHEIFICEMGANKKHDIKKLAKLFKDKLRFGIITSVGKQHLEGFKSIDNICYTKYELAEAVYNNGGKMVFNIENEYVLKMFLAYKGEKIATFIDNNDNKEHLNSSYLNAIVKQIGKNGSSFDVEYNDKNLGKFHINLLGEHNIINSILAISVGLLLNENIESIKIGLERVYKISNRLELKTLKSGATLIDNGFNSNPDSAEKSLNVLSMFHEKIKIVATPGLIELDSEQYTENYLFGKKIAKVADRVIILNEVNKKAILNGLIDAKFDKEQIIFYKNFNKEFVEYINSLDESYVVLIENDLPSSYI